MASIEDPFLKEGWLDDENEKKGPNGECVLETFVVNKEKGWSARQVWGFAMVDGVRRHVRRTVVVGKGDKTDRTKLVYDFVPKKA